MQLSEAIRIGSTFRGESHSGPFVRVANSDDLLSDVYGAACEAVYSLIAKRNWNKDDKLAYSADIEALRQVQERYFADYFKMPAICPGAQSRPYTKTRGRLTGRMVNGENEFAVSAEKQEYLGAVTTICSAVTNLAELVEHCFYVHNWTREECAQAVEWFEQQSAPLITQNFTHYQDIAVQRDVSQRLTAAAIARHLQRQQRKSHFAL